MYKSVKEQELCVNKSVNEPMIDGPASEYPGNERKPQGLVSRQIKPFISGRGMELNRESKCEAASVG
ncbi:hypothetical protein VTJ04DRAFT_2338 [Mycothermus thermophilus]|uniref:uncharacterized protein n=1 Tax=Humicola insolens TaxID=85995 RepID=UPI003742FDE5